MIHIEKFLENVGSDDPEIMKAQPKLAARALAWLSVEAEEEPHKLKKGLPIYRHRVIRTDQYHDHGFYYVDVRMRVAMPQNTDVDSYLFAINVASMYTSGHFRATGFEFSPEGHTSTFGSSTVDAKQTWGVANSWHPLEPSIADYIEQSRARVG